MKHSIAFLCPCCLYVTGAAITPEDSANLTIHRVDIYVDKGGAVENGGDGAPLWKDCYLGPQPGTNQWKGADGFLSRSLRHGSTFDHVTLRHPGDDLANFHGIWENNQFTRTALHPHGRRQQANPNRK